MEGPISLLVLGTGYTKDLHIPSLRKLPQHFRVTGNFGRDAAKARALADEFRGPVEVFTDLDAALGLPGLEAVDVALPIGPVQDVIQRALSAAST